MSTSKELGVNNGQLAPMPKSPNAVSSQAYDSDKLVEALPMQGDVATTLNAIKQTLANMGRNTIQSEQTDYIHTVFVTPLMRYKDDVEFYISEAEQCVHFRSASRVGYSDLGANRKRYEAFKAAYR